ncbi:hypothetical protein RchiOBHm_Chr3g0454021 [Rosa chinensis]|uniref:Uncharacterized protein n=1 Tax=Rosa chinensis TaxID=74649 RepID=A0A2P6R6P7_ROSCH|nr:hypothetical protein RchiOBHm_Chr3g0454021 [Rosa chinensis]
MDGREEHLQSLGICKRLYNFIMRSLASPAFKSVNLGPPMIQGLPSIPPEDAVLNEAGTKCNGKVHPNPPSSCPDVIKEEIEDQISSIASQEKPLRKTVSINDEVEDMEKTLKLKRKKSKSNEKWNSLEPPSNEQIPLRSSILKVGSDLSKKMATFVNHNYN